MPVTVGTIGQSLLNSELYNGLAGKDAELLAAKLASISANSGSTTDKKLEAERNRLRAELQNTTIINQGLMNTINQERADKEKLAAEIAEKDALIIEWMHSNESFKRLARQYGKKLGVTDEQRQTDFDHQILNVAEEDPTFDQTKKTAGAKKRLIGQL